MSENENAPKTAVSGANAPATDLLEVILSDIGGTFKKYQILNYVLFGFTLTLSGAFGLSYVFTALNLDYRCLVPECELSNSTAYETSWLSYAVPYKRSKPSTCDRYVYQSLGNNDTASTCSADHFDHTQKTRCHEYVYRTTESSILNEFRLECDESWKLATVGTANNIGKFIFTPIMGILSDRYGRRTILIIGILGSTILACMRSFAANYSTFVALELLDSGVGSCTYSASFILAMEWIGVKDRVLLGTIISAMYPLGQVFLGLTAKYAGDFRHLLRIIYAPGLLILLYFWIAPESMRWLLVNGQKRRIRETLKSAEKMNGLTIRESTWQLIDTECVANVNRARAAKDDTNAKSMIAQIWAKPAFVIRFMICAFTWITSAFVSYGISLTSTSLAGDPYINFIVIAVAGIPAMFVCYFLMESCGRRWTLSASLSIGGAAIILSKMLPSTYLVLSITLFFIGKCFTTAAFTALYVYTSELWPTNIRHSIMSTCSTFGRVGAAASTLAPIMSEYWALLPYLMFGGMALTASVLVLKLPETLRRKLPDTLSEAEHIEMDSDDETS